MTVATLYPLAGSGGVSCDGYVSRQNNGDTWVQCHDGAGTTVNTAATSFAAYINADATSNRWLQIRRGIVGFDTSALGAGAVITAATLSLWCTSKPGTDFNPSVNIYGATPASPGNLVNADYGQCGSTPFCTAKNHASIATGVYTDFVLNAAGLAFINPAGVTVFSVREGTYDGPNVTPAWSLAGLVQINFASADTAGTANDPKLVVTYDPGTPAPPPFTPVPSWGGWNG